MKSSGSNTQIMRKTPVHHVQRCGSSMLSSRSAWTRCGSVQISALANGSVPGFTEKRPQALCIPGVSDWIASRSTRKSVGSTWIPEIAACFSRFSDGSSWTSDGNPGVLLNSPGLLYGFLRGLYSTRGNLMNARGNLDNTRGNLINTRGNPINTRGNLVSKRGDPTDFHDNPSDTLAIRTDFLRFQQEIAPFRRTKKKIRRETLGQNRGVSGIQTPVDRAQACSTKHPDGYREVPF